MTELPQHFKEQVFALGAAEVRYPLVEKVFKQAKCTPELEALVDSSEEALDVLVLDCPKDQLIEQVAVVYEALRTAFEACNNGKGLAGTIFGKRKRSNPNVIDELYRDSPAGLMLMVISSVKCVQLAAKAALRKQDCNSTTPPSRQ